MKGELFKLGKEMKEKGKSISEMRNKLQDTQESTDSDENKSLMKGMKTTKKMKVA